jgi:hypothetical protein
MGVSDLTPKKPNWTPCPHLCAQGCGIYPTRPATCAAFRCVWLQNGFHGDPEKRPDQLGVMFTVSDDHNILGRSVLVAWEVRPGGFAHAEPLLRRMAEIDVLVLKDPEGLSFRGPADVVAAITAKIPGWQAGRKE